MQETVSCSQKWQCSQWHNMALWTGAAPWRQQQFKYFYVSSRFFFNQLLAVKRVTSAELCCYPMSVQHPLSSLHIVRLTINQVCTCHQDIGYWRFVLIFSYLFTNKNVHIKKWTSNNVSFNNSLNSYTKYTAMYTHTYTKIVSLVWTICCFFLILCFLTLWYYWFWWSQCWQH